MDSYTPSLAELELRLAKLERQNRRLKRLGLLFLLIAGSGFLLVQAPRKPLSAAPGPATPAASYDTLVVHRLELRDKAGKLRGVWEAEGEYSALRLLDPAGKFRAALEVAPEGPFLLLLDPAGKFRTLLAVQTKGPGLELKDAAGKTRALLHISAEGPNLWLLDPAGQTRASLAVPAEGPALRLFDPAGQPRAALGVLAEGPSLLLWDPTGKNRAWLAQDSLSVRDAQGFTAAVGVTRLETFATGESHTTSAAAVTLFGKDGKMIWRAP